MKNAQVTFWSGVTTVTGANFLLEVDGKKILVDCGLLQGGRFAQEENWKAFPYSPAGIDFLFITHAHMDHIGRIPKLIKDGFMGTIYSTQETKEIAEMMLRDGLRLLSNEALAEGKTPLYSEYEILEALKHWQTVAYHEKKELTPAVTFYLKDAGHILGSAIIYFSVGSKNIVFTGDTGNSPTPLLRDTEEVTDADYLILDSVYGDRNHEPLEERRARFKSIIQAALAKGGALIIPTFSVERSQIMLYEINNMVENGEIPSVPVFLDSPLAIKVTEIYKRSAAQFNSEVRSEQAAGDNIFHFPKLQFTVTNQESSHIRNVKNPKIIIAGSGMSSGGRIIRHEKEYLPDPNSTILFVGYQVAGSLGRMIEEGKKEVEIEGKTIQVRAKIEHLQGYSSHKDSDHLVDFAEKTASRVKKIFVVMGEPKSSLYLVQKLRDNLNVDAFVPEVGKVYELEV